MPTPRLAAIFNSTSPDFDALTPTVWGPAAVGLIEAVGLRPGERVLDVCAGTGASALPAARTVGDSGSVVAVDFAQDLLDQARHHADAEGLTNIEFRCADVTALEPASPAFDALLCSYGVFFLPDMDQAMSALFDQVRSGGRVGLTVWHHDAMSEFTETFFESVQSVVGDGWATANRPAPNRPGTTNPSEPAPMPPLQRIDTEDKISEWLSDLGAGRVDTRTLRIRVPQTADFSWAMVLGSGMRGALDTMDDDQRAALRRSFTQSLARRGVDEVVCDTVVAVATIARP